jgi:uncharacterized metal-binding protein YceD (DUF177 family)
VYLCIFSKEEKMKEKDYFKQFDICFGNLSFGKHSLSVEVKDTFFEKFEIEDVTGADVQVLIELERKETLVILHFEMQGDLYSVCDLCLEEITIPVADSRNLILKFVSEPCQSDDEDIVFIKENTYSYNVEQVIFEYIYALMPMRKVHGETGSGTCNQEMLSLIENATQKPTEREDARWEALKYIDLEEDK